MLDHSKAVSDRKSVRLTFFFDRNAASESPSITELGDFKKFFEKMPDVVAPFVLTSSEPGLADEPHVRYTLGI